MLVLKLSEPVHACCEALLELIEAELDERRHCLRADFDNFSYSSIVN